MTYKVLKRFRDRFSDMKICEVGDIHEPLNKERARQLIKLGYIEPIEEKKASRKKKKADDKA